MENKLKFNSAICTSRSQSKRLLALGLKKETADMSLTYEKDYEDWCPDVQYHWIHLDIREEFIPAWSLHRLIEILDIWCLDLDFHKFDNVYEQIISYFEERVKEEFINKGYLEE